MLRGRGTASRGLSKIYTTTNFFHQPHEMYAVRTESTKGKDPFKTIYRSERQRYLMTLPPPRGKLFFGAN